jgi:hypothetical protein
VSEGRSNAGNSAGAPTVPRMILGRRLQERRQEAGVSLEKPLETYGADRQETDEFVLMRTRRERLLKVLEPEHVSLDVAPFTSGAQSRALLNHMRKEYS